MPTITLTWAAATFYPKDIQIDGKPWASRIDWWDGHNGLSKEDGGLYVIEIPDKTIVYAGQAKDFHSRLKGRSDSFRNFNLRAAVLDENQVYICTVAPSRELRAAERWLVRILYVRDAGSKNGRVFQNIEYTKPYTAPSGGLKIINKGARPDFLEDDDEGYNYKAGDWVGPDSEDST